MVIAHVTFTCYYEYEVEVNDDLYDRNPLAAEDKAIEEAYDMYWAYRSRPIADTSYDRVEVEFE